MAVMKKPSDVLAHLRSADELRDLQERVAALETELAETRRHHLRVAELTDMVEALLIPLARRDDAAVEQVLREFTDTLG